MFHELGERCGIQDVWFCWMGRQVPTTFTKWHLASSNNGQTYWNKREASDMFCKFLVKPVMPSETARKRFFLNLRCVCVVIAYLVGKSCSDNFHFVTFVCSALFVLLALKCLKVLHKKKRYQTVRHEENCHLGSLYRPKSLFPHPTAGTKPSSWCFKTSKRLQLKQNAFFGKQTSSPDHY